MGDDWKTAVNLGHFKAYGCRSFVYDESIQRGDKYSSRVLIGKLVGYERGATNIFYIYVPERGKVVRTSDVDFDVSRFDTSTDKTGPATNQDDDNGYIEPVTELYSTPVSTSSGGESSGVEEFPTGDDPDDAEYVEGSIDTGMPEPGAQTPPSSSQLSNRPEGQPEFLDKSTAPTIQTPPEFLDESTAPTIQTPPTDTSERRSRRERTKTSKALGNDAQGLTSYGTKRATITRRVHKVYFTSVAFKGFDGLQAKEVVIPHTYAQAMASPQADRWEDAMKSEVKSLVGSDTWDLINPLDHPSFTIVAGRWVFTLKADSEGRPTLFKARWVARGFTQRFGIDYDETYASVTKPATVKIMLALVAKFDMECKQYGLITAFLNALIEKHRIFVEMPHGFEQYDGKVQKICLLKRVLYGLKQSPLLWYEELTK